MTRRSILQAAFGRAQRRPNVVYVLVDQWRAQALGHRGDPNAQTPALDQLAGESFDFPNAVSGFPVCSPYRASLLSGQYAVKHGVVVNDVEWKPPRGTTMGERFRDAGYATGYIGKWHLFGSPEGKAERRLTYIPPERRLGWDYWKVCECTHNYNRSLYYAGDDPTARYWEGYDAQAQTRDATEWIRAQAKRSDPYFLLLSLGPPHDPYGTAPPPQQALYREREIALRPNVPASHQEEARKNLRGYYAHIAALDDCVKEVRRAIADSGHAEDTLLVFASDHGDMLQSHGLHHKQQPWEESIRVPFLVHYPRKLGRKRRVSRTPIDAPDIFPTLLGLAGLQPQDSAQGQNLAPIIEGRARDAADPACLLNLPVSFSVVRRQGFAEYRGLRTQRYTYVRSVHGPWLLYDNARDPYQQRNLATREARLAKQLDSRLERMLQEAGDEFLPGQRYVERQGVAHYREVNAPVGNATSPWGDWAATWR